MQVTKKRSEGAIESYKQVYGMCPPNQFALAEANKKLDKETEACYAEFPNYRIKKSIHT